MASSRWWRVRTDATSSGFAWDVRSLRFHGREDGGDDRDGGEASASYASASKRHAVMASSSSSGERGGGGEGEEDHHRRRHRNRREPLVPVRAASSGSAGDGFGPANAVLFVGGDDDDDGGDEGGGHRHRGRVGLGRIWGGRRERRPEARRPGGEQGSGVAGVGGDFWIGAEFDREVSVHRVGLVEPSFGHSASPRDRIYLECLLLPGGGRGGTDNNRAEGGDDDGAAGGTRTTRWVTVRRLDGEAEVDRPFERSDVFPDGVEGYRSAGDRGPIPSDGELVVPPRRPLRGPVCGVSYRARLHDHDGKNGPFTPDPDLYHSECCEGLWVCVTKSCGVETLVRACSFVRAHVPPRRRALWGRFVSPGWCPDAGPMRLVVLDGRTDEQPGLAIPELGDRGATGRGRTTCPFVITSREDLMEGDGAVTAHELVHGADMVIRQLYDPSFHEEVEDLYLRHRTEMTYTVPSSPDGGTPGGRRVVTRHEYGATNRDEFLAEAYMILLGMKGESAGYRRCGLSTREELEAKCPDVVSLLLRHFCAPSDESPT